MEQLDSITRNTDCEGGAIAYCSFSAVDLECGLAVFGVPRFVSIMVYYFGCQAQGSQPLNSKHLEVLHGCFLLVTEDYILKNRDVKVVTLISSWPSASLS